MRKVKSIIALSIIVFIPFGLLFWIRYHQTTGFASSELIVYPLLFGGLSFPAIRSLNQAKMVAAKKITKESITDIKVALLTA